MALRVLSAVRGWTWSNDVLIRQHLWPLLQQWNKDSSCLREATIVCILRLIGKEISSSYTVSWLVLIL